MDLFTSEKSGNQMYFCHLERLSQKEIDPKDGSPMVYFQAPGTSNVLGEAATLLILPNLPFGQLPAWPVYKGAPGSLCL